jgi:co-chaperonin GroES (HSP10)
MTYYDPTKIVPRRDWVLILADPRKEVLASGLILPVETGVEKVTEGTGRILRVGPGVKNDRLNLCVGDRVIYRSYLKYANPITCRLQWEDGRTKEHFLICSDDLFAVIPEEMEVGVFSGRPQNPVHENGRSSE